MALAMVTPADKDNKAIDLLANHILSNAILRGCSNIHVEPSERQISVRYRKEGVLFSARKLPLDILPSLIDKFKNMTTDKSKEADLPYDGCLNFIYHGQSYRFRLSIVPGIFGEHLVIWLE